MQVTNDIATNLFKNSGDVPPSIIFLLIEHFEHCTSNTNVSDLSLFSRIGIQNDEYIIIYYIINSYEILMLRSKESENYSLFGDSLEKVRTFD